MKVWELYLYCVGEQGLCALNVSVKIGDVLGEGEV